MLTAAIGTDAITRQKPAMFRSGNGRRDDMRLPRSVRFVWQGNESTEWLRWPRIAMQINGLLISSFRSRGGGAMCRI